MDSALISERNEIESALYEAVETIRCAEETVLGNPSQRDMHNEHIRTSVALERGNASPFLI